MRKTVRIRMLPIPVLCVILFSIRRNSAQVLPNAGCSFVSNVLRCDNVDLPGNFSVSLIPTNVTEIYLGSDCYPLDNGYYCNEFGDVKPLQSRHSSLRKVFFKGFQARQGGVIEFDVFTALLGKVKGHLTEFLIFESKIQKLEAQSFRGYRALRSLWMIKNGIRDISSAAFSEMGEAGAAAPLTELILYENAMTSFDWGVLQPVAATLQRILLQRQRPGLQKIVRSSLSFTLSASRHIDLSENRLTTIPMEVLETISGGEQQHNLDVQDNGLCPQNSNCSCCELKDLAQWAKTRTEERVKFRAQLECGPTNATEHLYVDPSTWDRQKPFASLLSKCH